MFLLNCSGARDHRLKCLHARDRRLKCARAIADKKAFASPPYCFRACAKSLRACAIADARQHTNRWPVAGDKVAGRSPSL